MSVHPEVPVPSRREKRRRQAKTRRPRDPAWGVASTPASLVLLAALLLYYLAPGFFYTPWSEGTMLVIGAEKLGEGLVRVEEREIYLEVEVLRDRIDPHFHWDPAEKTAVITTADRVVHMQTDSLTAEVNLQPLDLQFPLREEEGSLLLPLLFLTGFYDITVDYHPETGTVVIDRRGDPPLRPAELIVPAALRAGPGARHFRMADLPAGEAVLTAAGDGDWLLVRTAGGVLGYLPATLLAPLPAEDPPEPADPALADTPAPAPGAPPHPLVLVWEFAYSPVKVENIGEMPSLQVVSPTWFTIRDNDGTVRNIADPVYMNWARERGYQVWPLVGNGFNPDRTTAVLGSAAKRKKVIHQLLVFAQIYGLEGYNIDFENVHYRDRDNLTQFMREFYPLCREAGLVLSIDVTMISNNPYWSLCYDRRALAGACDYIMLMAYDQHWENAPVPGPVAGPTWVEQGLLKVLEQVPPEKLVLGVPFYTRLWHVESAGGGDHRVSSKSYSFPYTDRLLAGKNPEVRWDDQNTQFVATYRTGADVYQVWLEDEETMRRRLELVNQYGLAGVAAWRRGLEHPETWLLFEEVLAEYPGRE